ncbi:MAG: hypothetical protein ABJA66_19895, partial [Actinomycetota bacterium]
NAKAPKDTGLISTWSNASQEKVIKNPKCWTSEDKLGVNMMEQPCQIHTDQFRAKNQMLADDFGGNIFPNNPVKTYLSMWRHRSREGKNPDFPYPEIRFCLENIRRHINRMEHRLCCGEYCHQLDDRFKNIGECFKILLEDLVNLEKGNFPYEKCMIFLPKFVHVLEWITYFTITRPEIYFYEIADYDNVFRAISGKRGESKGREERAKYRAQFNKSVTAWKDGIEAYKRAGNSCGCMACQRIALSLKNSEIILVPTYEELSFVYFTKIRPVPMFAIGLIDLPYLLADGFEYSPYEFFAHDLFHTVGQSGGGKQLSQTICETVKEFEKKKIDREILFNIWNENTQILINTIRTARNEHEAKALAILLFVVLHEPAQDLENDYNFSPALPEPKTIYSRLSDAKFMPKFLTKANEFFFGVLDPQVINALDPAKFILLDTLKRLK